MTWYNFAPTTFDPETGLFSEDMKGLATNPASMAAGETSAPYLQSGWHPYNGTNVGDGFTGLIYDFAVSGAVSTITSPDFADGYEYRFYFEAVENNGTNDLLTSWFAETSAAYSATFAVHTWASVSNKLHGIIDAVQPRRVSNVFRHRGEGGSLFSGGNTVGPLTGGISNGVVTRSTSQKILRARFTISSSGTFEGGKIYMFKRLCHIV